jgi:hypothetical protein
MEPVFPEALPNSKSPSAAVRLYYRLKRFIPKRFRLVLRRKHVSKVLESCKDRWPIYEPAGRAPEGWPGWPDGYEFAFVLTHDVETQVGVDRVQRLAELEMECGFRSSFNFVPEGEYVVPADLRTWLTDRGFEVGVHDLHHDGNLYSSKRSFEDKAKRINHHLQDWGAVGFRSGFMLHNLEWAHGLNVLYEASTFDTDPFEPQPDGAHTIFPFWVPAPNGNGHPRDGYVELPYTLPQDSTVFIHLGHRSIDLWRSKLEWIVGKGGMALVIVHPDYTNFEAGGLDRCEFPVSLYREFLHFVRQEFASRFWHALPKEVAHFCRKFKPMLQSPYRGVSTLAGAVVSLMG